MPSEHGDARESGEHDRSASMALWESARSWIPGGLPAACASPVPLHFVRGEGAYIWDADGNRYLDLNLGMNSLLLGHNAPVVRDAIVAQAQESFFVQSPFPAAIRLAELLCERFEAAERVTFIESATKAANLAVRLARAHTGRQRFAKFVGGYHGPWDGALHNIPPGIAPEPCAPGVASSTRADVVLLPWNDLDACLELLGEDVEDLAALLMEPMIGEGYFPPVAGFLEGLRAFCDDHGVVLIFDEAITQSLATGGAAEHWGVQPDLVVIAKGAIGGGMPIAAVGGPASILDLTDRGSGRPVVPHGSTFAQHPLSVAGGIAHLEALTPSSYVELGERGERMRRGIEELAAREGWPELQATGAGNLTFLHWNANEVRTYDDHLACDKGVLAAVHTGLLDEGIFTMAGGRLRVSTATSDEDVDDFLAALARVVRDVRARG